VDGIHRRYKKDLIYTNIGSNLLVSVNPCKPIDAYDSIQPYLTGSEISNEQKTEAPQPHIYSIANHALVEKKQGSSKRHTANQSIMVCGESGSGKTEASKYVMHFLLQADKEHQKLLNASTLTTLNTAFGGLSTSASSPASTSGTMSKSPAVVAKGSAADIYSLSAVLGPSSVIFESFGNARTQHNDNSSRFGKYTKFQYSADHRLISAFTETFLLEQTRLVTVGEGEQNYHIFYALLNTKSEASKYKLTAAKDFKILCDGKNADNSSAGKGRNNNNNPAAASSQASAADELECSLREVSESLRAVGVSAEEKDSIWSLLAALLHLGNIQCKSIVDESKPQADENYEQVGKKLLALPAVCADFLHLYTRRCRAFFFFASSFAIRCVSIPGVPLHNHCVLHQSSMIHSDHRSCAAIAGVSIAILLVSCAYLSHLLPHRWS
jgi:myosin-5